MPEILITKEKYAKIDFRPNPVPPILPSPFIGIIRNCELETKIVENKLDFVLSTDIDLLNVSNASNYSRIIPNIIGYNIFCGPNDSDVKAQVINTTAFLPSYSCYGSNKYKDGDKVEDTQEKWFLNEYPPNCKNAVMYRKKGMPDNRKTLLYLSTSNVTVHTNNQDNVDIIFHGKSIAVLFNCCANRKSHGLVNRYYFTDELIECIVYNLETNFFYITGKNKFSCSLTGNLDEQKNIVITQGNFTDSENIYSVIGSKGTNYIEVSYANYVDGRGGNDVIIAKNFTTIKSYFGDFIYGKSLVLLSIDFGDIDKVVNANNTISIYDKNGNFTSVDKQALVKTADGLFLTPTKVDNRTNIVTNLQVTKVVGNDIALDDELSDLQGVGNLNFNVTKQSLSNNYHIIIGDSGNHIFYPDKEQHNFYWEAPSNTSNFYLFGKEDANITIAQASGIMDFSILSNKMLSKTPDIKSNTAGEIKIDAGHLHVTLLPGYKNITITFDGKKYYKLKGVELERNYCLYNLKVDRKLSVDNDDLLNHYNCFMFDSDKVLFFKLNNNLLLSSGQEALLILDYYPFSHKYWDFSIGLNDNIIKPEEFRERAGNPGSFRYYQPGKQGLQIYHNQPTNKNNIGFVDFKDKSILDFDMKVVDNSLVLLHQNNVLIKVENWDAYQPAREMMFAFNDAIVTNAKCIVSICNSGNIIKEFRENKGETKKLINEKDGFGNTRLHSDARDGSLSRVKTLLNSGANINSKNDEGHTPLHIAVYFNRTEVVKFLLKKGADLDIQDNGGMTPLGIANKYRNLNMASILREEKETKHNIQRVRHRRYHVGHCNRRSHVDEKVTSGAVRPSSWIDVFANAFVDVVKGIFQLISSPFKPAIDMEHFQPSKAITTQSIDTNGTLLLLDVFIRKITGQKYISTADQPMPLLEARGYALNITKEFEKILKDTAKRSGVSVKQLSFDPAKIFGAIEGKIVSGELSKIPTILYSAAREACSKNEKFLSILKGNIEKVLNEQQIVNNRHSSNQKLSMVSVDDKMPLLSSLNNIAIESVNSKKGVTFAG